MKFAVSFALVFVAMTAPAATAFEVTFYPGGRVYSYEANGQRDAHTLVLHNIGIRNETAAPVKIDTVTIELMSGERAIDSRTLGSEEIARAAASGAGLQKAGVYDMLSFQFGGARLLPDKTPLSSDPVLDPGEAIIVTSQIFAYRGARDAVRVRINGAAEKARIPIRTGMSQITYSLPLRGPWYNGAGATFHTQHRWSPMEEFAFDFVRLGPDFKTHRKDGRSFSDYYSYGEPVFAASDGRVASVVDGELEDPGAMKRPDETIEQYMGRLQQDQFARIAKGRSGIGGNSVVIDHGNGEFSFYAHLKPGSIQVREGDQVKRGQQIGKVGSSGNSTEPHLHFQVCDSADPLLCSGIPVQFEPMEDLLGDFPRAPQTGDVMSQPEISSARRQ